MKEDGGEEVEEGGEGGGEGGGERGRVAEVTKDPKVTTLQHFVGAETEKSQATPAQKSRVTPDRSHKRPLQRLSPPPLSPSLSPKFSQKNLAAAAARLLQRTAPNVGAGRTPARQAPALALLGSFWGRASLSVLSLF